MKTSFILLTVLFLAFTINLTAQINLVPNKVVYKRIGKNLNKISKTFEVTYAVPIGFADRQAGIGFLKDEEIKKQEIEANLIKTMSYWQNFDTNLEEHLGGYTFLISLDYSVKHNNNSILSVQLKMVGEWVKMETEIKRLNIDLRTGKEFVVQDVFDNLERLADKIDKAKIVEIKRFIEKNNQENKNDQISSEEILEFEQKVTAKDLKEFSISDKGITFFNNYNIGFIDEYESKGKYFFTWTELKPYIKRDGLLGQFVR